MPTYIYTGFYTDWVLTLVTTKGNQITDNEPGFCLSFKNSDLLHSGQPGTKFPRICIEVTIMRALHDGGQADEPHPLGRHFLNVGSAYSDECKAKQSATGLSDRLAVQKATCFTCGIS